MKLQWDTELQWIRQWGDGKAAVRREGFLYENVFSLQKSACPLRTMKFKKKKQAHAVKQPVETWSEKENKSLVEFVLFHTTSDHWPCYPRSSKFWTQASEYMPLGETYRNYACVSVSFPNRYVSWKRAF